MLNNFMRINREDSIEVSFKTEIIKFKIIKLIIDSYLFLLIEKPSSRLF